MAWVLRQWQTALEQLRLEERLPAAAPRLPRRWRCSPVLRQAKAACLQGLLYRQTPLQRPRLR